MEDPSTFDGIPWDSLRFLRILWDSKGFFRFLKDFQGNFRGFLNIFKGFSSNSRRSWGDAGGFFNIF